MSAVMVERDHWSPAALSKLERAFAYTGEKIFEEKPGGELALRTISPPSRDDWRRLPLRFVLIPCNDAPVLAFDWDDEGRAELLREELKFVRSQYLRIADPKKRAHLARRARRAWFRLIELAIGTYVLPTDPRFIQMFGGDE